MNTIFKVWKTSDKYFSVPIILSIFSTLVVGNLYLIFYRDLPSKLPLFYSLPWGSSQLVSKQQIFILPGVTILITLINSLLASQLHPVHLALKRILALSLITVNVIILITAIKVLLIFVS